MSEAPEDGERSLDFVRQIVEEDLASGRRKQVVTRFPPEPNGFLHIGHAKAICLDFGVAEEYEGRCHLRFDDTNPETEDPRYVAAIKRDVRWLGFDWGEHEYYASDYFEQLYDWAVRLIGKGAAYVDDLSEEQIREYRGTISEPGRESPFRNRPVEENLELFARMRDGEFSDGSRVLRAKIDMAHPNMKMRDPLMYRIRHAEHYRRGNAWCIYPFYDWAHGQSDAIEGITHSLCTLEFESNRELYDWYLEQLELEEPPRQYEFARLNVDYTVTSKRKLLRLVQDGHVAGWDDPRMPTLAGMRRRGITPEAIRAFCDLVGVARSESRVDPALLEYAIRDDLNHKARRLLCVLRPLKVVLTTWPEDEVDELQASYWPHDVPREGTRTVPFGRTLYIERDDFAEDPPEGFHRLAPGREVRLRYGYVIRCDEVVEDAEGEVVELRCSHDPDSRGGATADGRRVRGTIHWVSAAHAVRVRAHLYDRLFSVPEPGAAGDFLEDLNPDSLTVVDGALAEPAVREVAAGEHVQFERLGYFFADPENAGMGEEETRRPVFNRVVTLRDTWAKKVRTRDGSLIMTADGSVIMVSDEEEDQEPVVGTRSEARDRARREDADLAARFARYQEELGLPEADADVLTGDARVAELYDAAVDTGAPPADAANWLIHELLPLAGDGSVADLPVDGVGLAELVGLVGDGTLSSNLGRTVLREMAASGESPGAIVERRGLRQVADPEALVPEVDAVLAAHPDKVREYRDGRTGLLGFFMGQVMRRTGGKAKPELVRELLQERLDAPA